MTSLLTYHNGINDCWKFMRFYLEHGDPDDQSFWDGMVAKIEEINNKYKNEYVKTVLFATANEVERVRRRISA